MTEDDADLRADALAVLAPGFVGTQVPGWAGELLEQGLGGLWLFGHNVQDEAQVCALTAAVHAARPEALVCADEEGGTVTRVHHRDGSPWPGAWALGVVDDVGTTRAVAQGLGVQLHAAGVDLAAAPVADVNSEPDNPVIGARSFGADPALVSRHVRATVEGLREGGVLSCAKHFPGHGSTRVDSHLDLPVLDVDADLLATRELVPFAEAVRAGVDVVMTGHLVVPEHGELPATLNSSVLNLLRDDLGFDGVICTDALDMAAVARTYGRERSAVLALAAGVDLLCVGNPAFPGDYDAEEDTRGLVEAVLAAVRDEQLPRQRLHQAAERVRALGTRQAANRADPRSGVGARAGSGVGARAEEADASRVGRDAAALAVTVTGPVPTLDAPVVVALSRTMNIASGARAQVVVDTLAARTGGTVAELGEVGGQTGSMDPLLLVSDDQSDLHDPDLQALVRRCAVLVHTGVRDLPADLHPACLVRTFGGGLASALAAADALTARPVT
ncbi:glycoside hydrolase family 3 protein [Ornithinimicrobium sp. LYQ92]|uniref:glycoside hydrolase family 3 protein n=1 Tax=Serinicoccus sp. LYQ92 TaxID=3378798 RepID=UPI0038555CCF